MSRQKQLYKVIILGDSRYIVGKLSVGKTCLMNQ